MMEVLFECHVALTQAESNHVSRALIDNKLVLIVTQVQICRTQDIIILSDTFSRRFLSR